MIKIKNQIRAMKSTVVLTLHQLQQVKQARERASSYPKQSQAVLSYKKHGQLQQCHE